MTRNVVTTNFRPPRPRKRSLQIYAFDPSLDLDLELARINRSVIDVIWEDGLLPGPVGEYLEVLDVDPPSQCAYEPVDLDDPHLIAEDGLPPSEGTPQFHQQMVYAVAMKTIANFEQALGRSIHWSPRPYDKGLNQQARYVRRLRIYPHATREANAYYSPEKKALLLGYFNALNTDAREGLPGGVIFSCLSHDVVAHEMTHAILDGVHRRLLEATNADSLALHEAFADLVAIFQHFTLPDVVEAQIRHTRGDLAAENLLAKLAVQFGRATRHGNALRDVLGKEDEQKVWRRREPDPELINLTFEPHARGAILVAAVFDAFLTIYKSHISDLLRIASQGSGILPAGALHPDLVVRLADEAIKVAQRLLTMCIRALDYLPPVDVTFGDYLRALITSDINQVPEDDRHYRIAIISAFRDWGLYPRDVRALSVESLQWSTPRATPRRDEPLADEQLLRQLLPPSDVLRLMTYARVASAGANQLLESWEQGPSPGIEEMSRLIFEQFRQSSQQGPQASTDPDVEIPIEQTPRWQEYECQLIFARFLHLVLQRRAAELGANAETAEQREALQIRVDSLLGVDLYTPDRRFEIHAVRPTLRVRADGKTSTELVIMITQRRFERLSSGEETGNELNFRFRSGCTLLIDPTTAAVRYTIVKRMHSAGRLARQKAFLARRLASEGLEARARYGLWTREDDLQNEVVRQEPFRLLHRGTMGDPWDE